MVIGDLSAAVLTDQRFEYLERASKIFQSPQLECAAVRNSNLEARWNVCGACFASIEAAPLTLTERSSLTKAALKPFLVMISAAAPLWCAAMAIHLANADVPTSIG